MKSSALRLFERGVKPLQRLRSEVEAFERGGAYTFRMDVESRTTNSITYGCVATERQSPSDERPLLAWEAIQNLRSSLDHVRTVARSRNSETGRATNSQFPGNY